MMIYLTMTKIRLRSKFELGFIKCSPVGYYVVRPLFAISRESVPPMYKWLLNLGWVQIIRMN
jgi:hypothetical protein